jgi:hypothetical protein
MKEWYIQFDMWSDKEAYRLNYDTADQTLIMTRQIKLQLRRGRSNFNYDEADQKFDYDTTDQALIMTRRIKLWLWRFRSNARQIINYKYNHDTADQTLILTKLINLLLWHSWLANYNSDTADTRTLILTWPIS